MHMMEKFNTYVNNIKKLFNKDITEQVTKYRIPLITAVIVILLACISIFVTYAFYKVEDVTPIVGGSTGDIADLDLRIMVEDRNSDGSAKVGEYILYPYIPQAGYEYNEAKSYCTNGSTINYNEDIYDVDIVAQGHDVCYMYFDSTAELDITLYVWAENVNSDGEGTGDYTKLETQTMPSIGYELNSEMTTCTENATVSYSSAENKFNVSASGKAVCNAYMDAMDVDIALKIYLQAKTGSSLYYEDDEIPTNVYYELNNTKSSCTGTSTLDIQNQKVVVAATTRTNCVAYLDVSSGPMLESMHASVSGQNVTLTLNKSNEGTNPSTYYYSSNNGDTYVSSSSNSYTFSNLTPLTSYIFKAYAVDSSGKESSFLTVTAETEYVYNGVFSYRNSVQTKTIEVSGYYYLQVWGAQGGYRTNSSYAGKGGYSKGYVYLNAGDVVYVYTGGAGGSGSSGCGSSICAGGYNGGGYRYKYYGGGGSTDIRINQNSLYARVIVAGGGGSDGAVNKTGMYGGGTVGGSSNENYTASRNYCGKGGNQTYSGYSTAYTITSQATSGLNSNSLSYYGGGFGFGGGGVYLSSGYGGAGGGGWYGGSGTVPDSSGDDDRGGGGGSGYVYTESTASSYPSGCLLNSSYYMSNAATYAGNTSFESATGGTETGHSGNGYAKITYVGKTLS